jgi:hypothetical protein
MDPQHWLQVPDGGLLPRVGVDERTHQEFNPLARVQNLRLQREIIHQNHPGPDISKTIYCVNFINHVWENLKRK